MKITINSTSFEKTNSKTLLLFSDSSKKLSASITGLPSNLKNYSYGDKKTCVAFQALNHKAFENLLIVGYGKEADVAGEDFRRLGGVIQKKLKELKLDAADIVLPAFKNKSLTEAYVLECLVEGLLISEYSFDDYKSKSSKKGKTKEVAINISNLSDLKSAKASLAKAMVIAEQVNFARRLGDTPGNLMTPTILAKEAQDAAKGTGVKVTIWDKARIKKEKMGGLLGVSLGSDQDPRFIIMEYKGGKASDKPICLVGKGLTFDAGGISIKPAAGMDEMKYDMCGSTAVIAGILAIAKLKLKVNVTTLVPSTENLLGGSANKPGDILTFRNGKTAEVLNTDAEGRLILADALCYASELKPKLIADAATLTGAMVVALGNSHTGFFTKDDKLASTIDEAGKVSEEPLWRMPLTSEHLDDVKGTFADLSNIGATRGAGSATAAAFLAEFVEEGIPYAHFDIAGTAWNCGNRREYLPKKGATGVLVRTFVELASKYQ